MADSSSNLYQAITLYVSDAAPGQKIAVQLTANGAQVAFSSGPAFQANAGVSVVSQMGGALPLAQFSIDSSQATFLTNSGSVSGALTFRVAAYLVATPDITTFYLRSSSDPGVQVAAGIGNSVPQLVNATQTLFSWNPM